MHPQSETTEVVFESGSVVQLVRIHACHAWGRGFESRPDRQEKEFRVNIRNSFLFPCFLKHISGRYTIHNRPHEYIEETTQ